MAERARQRAQRELAEARRLLDADDAHAALRPLERARRDALAAADEITLRQLRAAAEDGYRRSDPGDEPAYERLLYASAQNIRFLSRRTATAGGREWIDPHPELDRPDRPEIRAEHGVSRRDIPWILLAGIAGVVVACGVVAYFLVAVETSRVTVVNDTRGPVRVGACDTCTDGDAVRSLGAGARLTLTHSWSENSIVVVGADGRTIGCLHAAGWHPTVRISAARACPDTSVSV